MDVILIGLGRILNNHLVAIHANKLNLIAACDIDNSKLTHLESRFSDKTIEYSVNLGHCIKLDASVAIVASATGAHFEITKKAITSYKHIILEKPAALSLSEIDKLVYLSNNYGVKVSVCHQNRFNKSVQRLRESIIKRRLGKLYYGVASIRWNRSKNYYDQANWRGKWRSDGGALMNQSIHNIDLLLWMMGSPVVEVFGYIDNKNHPSIEVEDMGVALLKFANGSFGIIESSMNTYPENFEETLSIFGEKGTVVLGGKSVNKIIHWNVKDDPIDDLEKFNEEVDSVYGNGHIALYKDFIEAIEQDREPAITLQDGRNAVEVILAIYLSSFEKRPVQLPLPADTSTIMFEGKSFK
jgi:UDP-N-acetyl-2-amino-2-deoxyglucuronate dehydrogenase